MKKDLAERVFEAIDEEIGRMVRARTKLHDVFYPGAVTNAGPKKKHRMSAAARARISRAQKRRWATWQKKNRKAA